MVSFCSRQALLVWLTYLSCSNNTEIDAFTPSRLAFVNNRISQQQQQLSLLNGNVVAERRRRSLIRRNMKNILFIKDDDDDDDEQEDDDEDDDDDEEEEEVDPYTEIAQSEFEDDFKSKSSALAAMTGSSMDWGGAYGELQRRVDDIESGVSQNPSQALFRLFSAKTPNQLIGTFVSSANPEVIQAMSGAVSSLLGGLSSPQMGIETIVKASNEKLGNLCFQLQMTGYMFRNAEYVVALKKLMNIKGSGATLQDYRDAFDRLDVDQSGYIDVEEIKILFEQVYEDGKTPYFEIENFLTFFDRNNDGKISWEEFERGLGVAFSTAADKNNGKTKSNNLLPGEDEEEEEEEDYIKMEEPEISGTLEIELKNGQVMKVDAKEYIESLKQEALALEAELRKEKGGGAASNGGGGTLPGTPQSNNMPENFTGITQYILERQGDLQSLTEGISPEIVESMKLLVNFVLEKPGGDKGGDDDDEEMEIPGSALQQLALWQLILGYRLREAEATGEYLKLLE